MSFRGGLFVGILLLIAILPLLASAKNHKPHHADPKTNPHHNPKNPVNPNPNAIPTGPKQPDQGNKIPQPKPAPTNLYAGDENQGQGETAYVQQKKAERETQKKGMKLREDFYESKCPQAEKIVHDVMKRHFEADPGVAPALVRLFFHDCFVKGCDASLLLDQTPGGKDVEKKASQNGPLVRGYNVIDDIKAKLEKECPSIVSCADILAFASRDSLVFTGIRHFKIPAGRRDGLSSLAENVNGNLPFPASPMKEIVQIFNKKNMTVEELVVLIGAHSIGTAHCKVVAPRFHNEAKKKEMDPGYVIRMQSMTICGDDKQDLPFDPHSHHKMDSRFYKELLMNRALVESDHNIAKDPAARNFMEKMVDDQNGWVEKFIKTFVKMGMSSVLTGNDGEIRKQCRAVNVECGN